MNQLEGLVPRVMLSVSNAESASNVRFGGPIADLCVAVREHGSLNAAAASVGMTYSRAWKVVKDVEDDLGFKLFVRSGCLGSSLTPEGERLLDAYLATERELNARARLLYEKAAREARGA